MDIKVAFAWVFGILASLITAGVGAIVIKLYSLPIMKVKLEKTIAEAKLEFSNAITGAKLEFTKAMGDEVTEFKDRLIGINATLNRMEGAQKSQIRETEQALKRLEERVTKLEERG